MKRALNTIILVIVAAAVVALLTIWLRPNPVRVDVAEATRGPLRVTVDGEGKTRVRDLYVVAAPVAGKLRRIALRRGDVVEAGKIIAQIEPLPLAPLDPRQRAEAIGRVNAAEDSKREFDQTVARNKANYDQAVRDLKRDESLARSGVISRQELERGQTAVATTLREYEAARSKAESAAHAVEIERAALLATNQPTTAAALVNVKAPLRGKVLRVVEESERVIAAGAPIVELSNPSRLEVVLELLSTEAVKVSPGAMASIENWGGPQPLEARVRVIEPAAFTKVSALGIEEQRVNVVADLVEVSALLGDGYRVEGSIVIWESENALKVPVSALFRRGESWSLFVVEGGAAHLRDVEVGHRTPFEAEITSGLQEGAQIIVHPSNQVIDGARVVFDTE
jgi:HlyD family secretion protein